MAVKQVVGAIAVVATAALVTGFVVSYLTGRGKDERVALAERDLAAVKDTLEAVRDTAEMAMREARMLEEQAREDSARRASAVREVERRIELDLEAAAAAEDSVREALEQVAPDILPVFDRLMTRQKLALGRTQFLLDDERAEHDKTRSRVRTWQTAAFTAETRALTAERAAAAAERALSVAKEQDIELPFGLGGLDVTCGPGAAVSFGTKGADLGLTVGCTAGK